MTITRRPPLTPEEAAQILKISKYTLYELIKRGEIPSWRIGRKIRIDYDSLMHYLQGDSGEKRPRGYFDAQEDVSSDNGFCFMGSHDLSVELLAEFLNHSASSLSLKTIFKGSMQGLVALYHRKAQVTGIHLWDEKLQEYNLPFVEHILLAEAYTVVNLVQRTQGWIVAAGNKHNINSWEDITQKGTRFVNRQRGSGTRLRIDQYLLENEIPVRQIQGYEKEEKTHWGVALKVANGEADFGIGIQFAAQRMGLDFVPLFKERFDLVILQETAEKPEWHQIQAVVNSTAFKRAVEQHIGYDTSLTGKIIYETPHSAKARP
ncbi:MAG: helix-turn-helix transcriptional regulator [Syntrophomonas sp.]|nr:helix-turn-helix transcriptional regulator [Syntrophomonas sp.]MDD2510819.1 helix-turn-helix transcriptional regulator [Syntrophomonas sp.]MDD3879321.1 helix-turn-helix transcriptional regulator [Syntrophomonas sp.]MDD4627263.1 helix-turn-helix transcriptional regulator [Syntrophomonas sp.]